MPSAWRTKLREAWTRLRGGELTPWRAAASVAVGLAVGVTPLWGVHLPIVLAICVPLRLDAPVAYLAANISMPLIAPLLSFTEIEIGAWVRTGHGLPLDVAGLRKQGVAAFLGELVVGTAIFAPLLALVGGALTFAITARVKRKRSSEVATLLDHSPAAIAARGLDEAIGRVADRYARGRRAAYHYVRGKLAGDPVARAIAELGPLLEVTDVGCGRGQLAVLLLEAPGCAEKVRGFDWDAAKIEDARRAAVGLAASFDVGDLRTAAINPSDTVLLVDVLHYLTEAEQDALLVRAAGAARGKVVVRDLDPDRGWRSAVTRVQEAITTSLRWNRGARVRPRAIAELTRTLEAAGFSVEVEPCWGRTPFANVLIVATRHGTTMDHVSTA